MSVNSVSTGLPPSNSVLSGNNSRIGKSAAASFAQANSAQAAAADAYGATRDAPAPDNDAGDFQFQGGWGQVRRDGSAPAENSTGGAAESTGGRSSPGLALYQRVSGYGNSEPSTSALLERWNNIMQGGADTDSAATAFAKQLLQNETPGSESGVLDLTA
jgi:hypothetical protein